MTRAVGPHPLELDQHAPVPQEPQPVLGHWRAQQVPSDTRGSHRGIDAHNANPEEAKAVIAKHTGLKPEFVKDITLPAFTKKLVE